MEAGLVYLDAYTIVNGVKQKSISGQGAYTATYGVAGWQLPGSVFGKISGEQSYQLQTGDFEADGSVRLRLYYFGNSGQRAIAAGTLAGMQFRWEVFGPFA